MPAADLSYVDWLLEYGLGASARGRLDNLRGFDANQRRLLSGEVVPLARVYFLTTTPDGARAWSVPATVQLVAPPHRTVDARAFEALAAASHQVRELLGAMVLPRHTLCLEAERHTAVEGNSLGLAAALAYAWHLSGQARAALDRPVFATGRVLDGGEIEDVEFLNAKVGAALADLGARDGYVLVPRGGPRFNDPRVVPCATVVDAIERVIGVRRPTLDVRFVHFDRWLEDVDRMPSSEALSELGSVDLTTLAPADQCATIVVRGKHHRHLGETDAALADHERAVALTREHRLPADRRRHAELELANTRIDRFELDQVLPWFADVLASTELSPEREIEIRGSYSRAFAFAGKFEDALRERRATIDLHRHGAKAGQTEPRSLVELAQLVARCGDATAFDAAIAQLAGSRRPDVESDQSMWNTLACLRGNTALGRYSAIAAWHDGGQLFAGALGFEELVGSKDGTARADYPINTVVRTCVRSLRKVERCNEAIALGESLCIEGGGLVAWLAWLVRAERALALRALGRDAAAEAQLAEVRDRLQSCHPAACRRHRALIDGDWAALDREIDDVYY
jgi:hypothetical protein